MKITKQQAYYYAYKLGLRFKAHKFTAEDFRQGMMIELEHGKEFRNTNLTDDDLTLTAKIAWAHFREKWNYYRLLKKYVEVK